MSLWMLSFPLSEGTPGSTPWWALLVMIALVGFGWFLARASSRTPVLSKEEDPVLEKIPEQRSPQPVLEIKIEATLPVIEEIPNFASESDIEPLDELPLEIPLSNDRDDLRQIMGITPGVSSVLNTAGIRTFVQLSMTNTETLEKLLRSAGMRNICPDSWPEQARLASKGEWAALRDLRGRIPKSH